MLAIGTLNKRITFIGAEEWENRIGQIETTPCDIKTVWARVEPLRGREYFEAAKVSTENAFKITTRYHRDITPDMQIRYRDRIFEIQTIINPGMKNESLEIMCGEKVGK